MNKIYFNGKEITDLNELMQFRITLKGDNNTININSFSGPAIIYVYIEGDFCTFNFGKDNIVNNDIGINFWGAPGNKPNNSEIIIGNNNYFNGSNITIISPLNTKIIIGDSNLFAGSLIFWGRNDHIIYDIKTRKRLNQDRDIIIGNNNWICQEVKFLPGANIGDNNVIGFGSLINKAFNKDNTLIAGKPAKVKKKKINWSRSSNYDLIDFENNIKIKE